MGVYILKVILQLVALNPKTRAESLGGNLVKKTPLRPLELVPELFASDFRIGSRNLSVYEPRERAQIEIQLRAQAQTKSFCGRLRVWV